MILTIGNYNIDIIGEKDVSDRLALPEQAMRFQGRNDIDPTLHTIQLIINIEDYLEPDLEPIAGFEDGLVPYMIYQMKDEQYLWVRKDRFNKPRVVYRISKQWSCWELLYNCLDYRDYCSFYELSYVFPYSILNKNGVMFHGVVMEWKTMGILVCAGTGTGKTTHTKMWKEHENASILNGDRALCCNVENHWYTYGSPWNGSSGECMNKRVPLRAIVVLEQAGENQIHRLSPLQGILALIPLTFAPGWDEKQMNCAIDLIERIGDQIPIYLLRCKPDLEALAVLKKELDTLYLSRGIN